MYLFELVLLFFSNMHPEAELLGHMVFLFCFLKVSTLFSTVSALICIPTKSEQGFTFLHIPPTFVICVLFDDSHSDRCEVTSPCGFDLHFPDD